MDIIKGIRYKTVHGKDGALASGVDSTQSKTMIYVKLRRR
jgi:hypothetical protein